MIHLGIRPQDSESLDGFLRRLAAGDFWSDVADYLGQAGLHYGHRLIESLDTAAQDLGVEPGTLEAISPRCQSEKPILNWRFERHHSAPICPKCISEQRPHQQAWRHAFVTACTKHDLVLQDQCPLCSDHLRPGKGGYNTCACGGSLLHLKIERASNAELALSALIAGEMHPSRSCLPPALAFRTPFDVGDFLFFLAASGAASRTGKQGKAVMPKTVGEAQLFLAEATKLLSVWPAAFQKEASSRLQHGDQSASTAPERLGRWYQRLMRFNHPAYDDFRSILGEVINGYFDGPHKGAAGQNSDSSREWIAAAEAARIIGIRPDRIIDAVAKREINGKLYSRGFGHRHVVIRRSTADTIKSHRQRFGDKKALRNLWGVSRNQFDLLREAGFMASIEKTDLPALVDANFDLDAAREIADRIAAGTKAVHRKTVSLKAINLRFTTDRKGVLAVLRAILDGTLRPAVGSAVENLAALEFDQTEVEFILKETLRGPGLTVQEVGRMTGWKDQCIAHWCDLGLLTHETFQHAGRVGRLIRIEDLVRFQGEYVPSATLAKQMQTSSRGLMTHLREMGVELTGAFQDGSAWRGHLVRLADLAAAGGAGRLVHD